MRVVIIDYAFAIILSRKCYQTSKGDMIKKNNLVWNSNKTENIFLL